MLRRYEVTSERTNPWCLKHRDQAVVALGALIAVLLLAGSVVISRFESAESIEIEGGQPHPVRFSVDINTADWPELAQLPGIGDTLARRIVGSRELAGPFRSHDDLRRVTGIGAKKLARIEPFLRPVLQLPEQRRDSKILLHAGTGR
jgi:competence protein ComEA